MNSLLSKVKDMSLGELDLTSLTNQLWKVLMRINVFYVFPFK